MPGGRAAGRRRALPRTQAGARLRARSPSEGRAGFYDGAIAARDRAMRARQRRLPRAARIFARAPLGVGRAGLDDLPRLRASASCRRTARASPSLQMLNILEGFDLRALGCGSAEHLHLLIEAKKLAFEDRARFYADPDVRGRARSTRLVSKDYAAARRALIDPKRAAPATRARRRSGRRRRHHLPRDGRRRRQHGVADPEQLPGLRLRRDRRAGSASACRTAARCSRSMPGHANAYAPGKRPFHTIIPGFRDARRRAAARVRRHGRRRCSRRATCRC